MKKIDLGTQSLKMPVESLKFSERDIIRLQDAFLTPGFHNIKTYNRTSGRLLINALLKSLNYFHIIACLSTENKKLSKETNNIYQNLNNNRSEGYIQDFILEELFCDFLWIEKTEELTSRPWFEEFKRNLVDFGIDKKIPIITVSYKNIS